MNNAAASFNVAAPAVNSAAAAPAPAVANNGEKKGFLSGLFSGFGLFGSSAPAAGGARRSRSNRRNKRSTRKHRKAQRKSRKANRKH